MVHTFALGWQWAAAIALVLASAAHATRLLPRDAYTESLGNKVSKEGEVRVVAPRATFFFFMIGRGTNRSCRGINPQHRPADLYLRRFG